MLTATIKILTKEIQTLSHHIGVKLATDNRNTLSIQVSSLCKNFNIQLKYEKCCTIRNRKRSSIEILDSSSHKKDKVLLFKSASCEEWLTVIKRIQI